MAHISHITLGVVPKYRSSNITVVPFGPIHIIKSPRTLPLVAATPELKQYVAQYNSLKSTRRETRASLGPQRDALIELEQAIRSVQATMGLEESHTATQQLQEYHKDHDAKKNAYRQTKLLLKSQKDAMSELERTMQLAEAKLKQSAAIALEQLAPHKKPARDEKPVTPKDGFMSLSPGIVSSGSEQYEFGSDGFGSDSKGRDGID